MNLWLRIDGNPVRQFHVDDRALAFMDPKKARHELLKDAGTIRSTTGSENASISVSLINTSGQCSALFANPPLGGKASLFADDEPLFSGTITQIDLSETDSKISIDA